jgi:hypothetical protein
MPMVIGEWLRNAASVAYAHSHYSIRLVARRFFASALFGGFAYMSGMPGSYARRALPAPPILTGSTDMELF